MKHKTENYEITCGCRSVGECSHNMMAWKIALEATVDDFAYAMKKKLISKAMRDGKAGWDDPNWPREDILRQLIEHVEKGDMVDVANFAMFVWNQD